MWFPTVLACLTLFKLSTADFGLPVTIPNLRTTISGTIGKGVEPTKNILREMETIGSETFDMDVLFLKLTLQDAFGNMTEIQNNTLNSLMQAVNDNQTSPRKVFDRLYAGIKLSQEQLVESQTTILAEFGFLSALEKFKLLNASRGELQSSLDTLQKTLTQMDGSINKAQKAKPVTQDNIQNVVTKSQIADLGVSMVSMQTSITKLYQVAESSLKSIKFMDLDANKTYTQLYKMFPLKNVFNTTENRSSTIEKNLLGVVAKMNSTVLSGYKSIVKSSSKEGSSSIEMFLKYFNEIVGALNESASNFQTMFGTYISSGLGSLLEYFRNMVQFNLDAAAFEMFQNLTFAEACIQKCPLVNESLVIVAKMFEKCVQQQMDYLPQIEQMTNEFMQPLNALVSAPLEDFRICSSKLDKTLCLKKFTPTYLGNTTDMTSIIFRTVLDRRTQELYTVTANELGSALGRIESCVALEDTMESLMELRNKRMACYAFGNSTNFNDLAIVDMFSRM